MKKSQKTFIVVSLLVLIFATAFYSLTGFITIQPLGMLPDGITIWYFRNGTDLPFITSPDGLSLQRTGQLTLMNRMAAMSTLTDAIENKIILRLPYSKVLYSISTGGKEFAE
jgi:hypothetical protein